MTRLILASESPRRKQLLSLLEVPFEVGVSGVEEQVFEDEEVEELVARLAREKAEAVFRFQVSGFSDEQELIIGADTVISIHLGDG